MRSVVLSHHDLGGLRRIMHLSDLVGASGPVEAFVLSFCCVLLVP
jgi:hypothetical protein